MLIEILKRASNHQIYTGISSLSPAFEEYFPALLYCFLPGDVLCYCSVLCRLLTSERAFTWWTLDRCDVMLQSCDVDKIWEDSQSIRTSSRHILTITSACRYNINCCSVNITKHFNLMLSWCVITIYNSDIIQACLLRDPLMTVPWYELSTSFKSNVTRLLSSKVDRR